MPRLAYNAPVVLTLALLAIGVHLLDAATPGSLTTAWFALPARFDFSDWRDWLRLFTYPLGHGDGAHLMGNLLLWLVIGPLVEEKYGSLLLLEMVAITALVTAGLNLVLFRHGLLGMSGLVFMLIVLASVTNFRSGEIPLTFVLVAALYLGREVVEAFRADRISQFAHLLGGLCGSVFGFVNRKR
jgi:membrane associated rhomboid family serine protease